MVYLRASSRQRQQGITSFFAVIFAAALFTIIALSFATLMSREQRRSSDTELSQSAYDSAMAGVEDAKRVVMLARSGDGAAAQKAQQAIEAQECNTVAEAGVAGNPANSEVLIQSSVSGQGAELNQYYTCVKISMDSSDYLTDIDAMRSSIVPLKGAQPFDTVRIEWHSEVTEGGGPLDPCSLTVSDPNQPLCLPGAWGSAPRTPALLRAQFITPRGGSINLDRLDRAESGSTIFLYPRIVSDSQTVIDSGSLPRYVDQNSEMEAGAENRTQRVECWNSALNENMKGYHCRATIELGYTVPEESDISLLRLTSLYTGTSARIQLLNGNSVVQFRGIQPSVDSTGRANDLFRRVDARLSFASDVSYPEYALDINGSLCKDFYLTSDTSGEDGPGYVPGGAPCRP